MSKRKLENSNQNHHHDGESQTKQQTQWEDDDNTQTNFPNNIYSSPPKLKKQKNENDHHPITSQIDHIDAPQQGEGEGFTGGIIGGGYYLLDYFGDHQSPPQQQEGSILPKFNSIILQLNDSDLYQIGYLAFILGYFNKFKNGKDNDKKENGQQKWHAEIIGNGGFGTVLKITKRNTHTKEIEFIRAVKVIPNSTMGLSGAILAAKLNHPNVVKVYNVMLIRNICCIEMEYIQCGSLKDLIEKKNTLSNLTPKIIGKMLYQCCEVLSLMKQFGMVHSDIKPDNIMIRDLNDFNVAIGDFGLTLQNETIAKQSEGGMRKYWAPELFKNFKPTFHSDIYALGKTFQELESSLSSDKNEIKEYLLGFVSEKSEERESSFYDFVTNTNSIWDNDEQYIRYCLRKDREFVSKASQKNGNALEYVDELFRNDRGIILETVKQDGNALEYVDESFKKDRAIVLEAVKQNGNALVFVDESLKIDRQFVLEVVKRNGNALQYVDELFKIDKEIVLEAIKQNGNALQHADKSLRKDREFMLEAVKQNGYALEYVDESFKKDREIVLEAVKQDGYVLEFADKSFKKDRQFVLEAVKQNGGTLEHVDVLFRQDREIVLQAVKQYGNALKHVDESLRKDKEIVLEAVKQNRYALIYADESLGKDREFMLEVDRLIEARWISV